MEPAALVAIALAAVFLLIFLHVPIGVAMALVGVTGFAALSGWTAALRLLSTEPASLLTNIDIAVIPLFLLMGSFANTSGIADDIYDFAAALVGHIRGGLALATIVGCGLFGSIAGSSVATTAAFGRIALPQMRARRYKAGMTAGSIAGGVIDLATENKIDLVEFAAALKQAGTIAKQVAKIKEGQGKG